MTDPEPAHPAFSAYLRDTAYDEMFDAAGSPRPPYRALHQRMLELPADELRYLQQSAELSFLNQGITFTVYGQEEGTERIFPYDLVPRILTAAEWRTIELGLTQRITALNLFLKDIYHEGKVLADGVIPRELVYTCRHYRREMRGIRVPRDVYTTVVGTDLVRVGDGRFLVLEDNLRVPSGVSYMLANRQVMKRVFPRLFSNYGVRPVDTYGQALLASLRALAPAHRPDPVIVLLSPGVFNSAYFEHTFLARQMGIPHGRGPRSPGARSLRLHAHHGRAAPRRRDLPPRGRRFHRPGRFPARFDPGGAGLFNAYRTGNVALANAVGTGVADDKAIYAYVPALIRYYLAEDPVLENVETFVLSDEKHLKYTLEHLDKLVVKAVGESGGYGMLIGPTAPRRSARRSGCKCWPTRATTSPSRRSSSPARPASSATSSNPGTSICGPLSSTARRSRSCPAA